MNISSVLKVSHFHPLLRPGLAVPEARPPLSPERGAVMSTWNAKWGLPKILGTFFGGPHNKDYSILGSILGSPYFGKLPSSLK